MNAYLNSSPSPELLNRCSWACRLCRCTRRCRGSASTPESPSRQLRSPSALMRLLQCTWHTLTVSTAIAMAMSAAHHAIFRRELLLRRRFPSKDAGWSPTPCEHKPQGHTYGTRAHYSVRNAGRELWKAGHAQPASGVATLLSLLTSS
jgi:hypothetical protein